MNVQSMFENKNVNITDSDYPIYSKKETKQELTIFNDIVLKVLFSTFK